MSERLQDFVYDFWEKIKKITMTSLSRINSIILAFVGLLRVQASYSLDMQRNSVITCMTTPFCATVNK